MAEAATWAADAALVVVGHGSALNPLSSRATLDHVEKIRRLGLFAEVRAAFWKEKPFLGEVLDGVSQPRVFVVPNLACKGYITGEVIPRAMGLTGPVTERRGQRIHLADPVGTHPLIAATIAERAGALIASGGLEASDTCVLLIGHGSARNRQSSIQTQAVADALGLAVDTRTAFLEHPPLVQDWPGDIAAANVIAMPFMISNGLHGAEDIPALLGIKPAPGDMERMAADGTPAGPYSIGGRKLWYCRAVGSEPVVADIMVDQAKAAMES